MKRSKVFTHAIEEVHLIAVRAMIDGSLELGRHPNLGLEHSTTLPVSRGRPHSAVTAS